MSSFFVQKFFLHSLYVLTIWVCNFLAKGFLAQKMLKNVGEMDTWSKKVLAILVLAYFLRVNVSLCGLISKCWTILKRHACLALSVSDERIRL